MSRKNARTVDIRNLHNGKAVFHRVLLINWAKWKVLDIDIVDLLLQFIRSTGEAGWNLHIQCLLEMMPW